MANILQIGKFYPPQWGGIETVTYNLKEILERGDYQLTNFVFGQDKPEANGAYDEPSVKRFPYIELFRTPISFSLWFRLLKDVHQFDYVIVHLPNPWVVFCLLCSGYKGKIILYWHCHSVGPKPLKKLLTFFESILFKRCKTIWGATNEHLKIIPGYEKFKNKCEVLSYPVSQEFIDVANNTSERQFLTSDTIRLLNVARLVEYKGQIYLVKAVKELLARGKSVHLSIVGDGPLYDQLMSYIKANDLADNIDIHRNLSTKELNKIFSKSDLFCFPSITNQEMYGMAQIEAYANGLPAIVSDIPESGVAEVAVNSGAAELVPPGDISGIADKVEALAANKGVMKRYSDNAKNFIKSYSHDKKLKEIANYFRS